MESLFEVLRSSGKAVTDRGEPCDGRRGGQERLKVTERTEKRRDEGMEEKGEMKERGERCGGRPGGDQ